MLRRKLLGCCGALLVLGKGYGPTQAAAQTSDSNDLDTLKREVSQALGNEAFLVSLRDPDQSVWRQSLVQAHHGMFGTRRESRNIPEETFKLIIAQEVGGPAYFQKFRLDRLIFPGSELDPKNHSGPTIGMGYDIGQLGKDDTARKNLHDDWDAFISKDAVNQLLAGIGLKGREAVAFVKANQNLSVSWEVADKQLRSQMLPYLVGDILDHLPSNAAKLPDRCMGAICSLVYNRGMTFKASGPQYREMRNINAAIDSGDFSPIPNELISMRRLWNKASGLYTRRIVEGKMFQAGLLEAGKPTVPLNV